MAVVLVVVVVLAGIVGFWGILEKADRPGWVAIVPFYNFWTLTKAAGCSGAWFIIGLIPFVNVVALAVVARGLARQFGKSGAFALGLFFLPPIFFLVLGYGDAQYLGTEASGRYSRSALEAGQR